jgi:hypothetical protein
MLAGQSARGQQGGLEFIRAGGKQLLIDFNPRFYSQMGFDIARGSPLPLLVYEAACGHEAQLAEVSREALAWKGGAHRVQEKSGVLIDLHGPIRSISSTASQGEIGVQSSTSTPSRSLT